MPNGLRSPRSFWSLSALTLMDPEKSPTSSPSSTLCLETTPTPLQKDFNVLVAFPRPRDNPGLHDLGWLTQLGLGFGCTCVVANLYYCQPLLIEMAKSFHVSYATVAWIPTMYQAGYCVGVFFISPLGDLVRRRQLILVLLFITTCLSIALAFSRSLVAFQTLAVLIGVFNVTPQILIPMTADLVAPRHRVCAVSIIQSGIMLGILLARVLAGVIAHFTKWRTVYYIAVGVQAIVLCGAYFTIPDHPPKNSQLSYGKILYSMVTYAVTEPKLVQAALINIASVAGWTNFWVTLTFLLGDEPYHFSTLYIGLFGLIGILGVFSGPLAGRLIDRLGPWYSVLVATFFVLILQSVEMAAGGINIAAVVIVCFGIDAFRQTQTVSLQTIVFSISEEARSRLNAILAVSLFAGQAIGSSAGSHVFLRHGWRAGAALSVGFCGWQLLVLLLRGPNCGRYIWFGYDGGFVIGGQRHCRKRTDTTDVYLTTMGNGSGKGLTTLVSVSETWPPSPSYADEEEGISDKV